MSVKLIAEIVAANVISKAITDPSSEQVGAVRQQEFIQHETERLRDKCHAMISDMIRSGGKVYTPEQIVELHQMADVEMDKAILAGQQKANDPAPNQLGWWLLGIIAIVILYIAYVR